MHKNAMQVFTVLLCFPALVAALVAGAAEGGKKQKSLHGVIQSPIFGGSWPTAPAHFLGRDPSSSWSSRRGRGSGGAITEPKHFPSAVTGRDAEAEKVEEEPAPKQRRDREPRENHGGVGSADHDEGYWPEDMGDVGDVHVETHAHQITAAIVFIILVLSMLCCAIPLVWTEHRRYHSRHLESRGFLVYLKYRFTNWFDAGGVVAAAAVLTGLTMAVISLGAVLYWLATGEDPAHSLFRIFCWSTAASMSHREKSVSGRAVGVLVTFCGLVILALLLGMVSEMFSSQMQKNSEGQHNVVEGGHIVVLGLTDCTKSLIEEIAIASEPEGGAFICVLDQLPKIQVDALLKNDGMEVRSSRVDVRMGRPDSPDDLLKVAADAASQVVILADTSVTREESDAKTLRTLVTLTGQGWPVTGTIVVQCCMGVNRALMQSLQPGKIEVVVVGDIVARLMAQSFRQKGLSQVFSQTFGFADSEFHTHEWPELVGQTFKDSLFRFTDAIPIGIISGDSGTCQLNPEWHYKIKAGDKVVVLAEDADTYKLLPEPYYVASAQTDRAHLTRRLSGSSGTTLIRSTTKIMTSKLKILVAGWNYKIGMLLVSLEHMLPPGTTVEIYSSRTPESRTETLENIKKRRKITFNNLTVQQIAVPKRNFTSRAELEKLSPNGYDGIFMLADVEQHGSKMLADEHTLAFLMQLKDIYRQQEELTGKEIIFEAVAEICEDSTEDQMRVLGHHNLLNTDLLTARALAGVTLDRRVNAVFTDLLSKDSSDFDICELSDFMPAGCAAPSHVSFADVTRMAADVARFAVVGWSALGGDTRTWEINPTDKMTARAWSQEDRVVLIRLPQAQEYHDFNQ